MKTSKIKETPEQIAAREARSAELAKMRAEEAAAAKQAKKVANEALITRLSEAAVCLSNAVAVEETDLANADRRCRRWVGESWLATHEELVGRADRLLVSPADYFEWAEADMKAAAKREILDCIIHRVLEGKPVGDAMVEMVADIKERVMNNYDRPSSTSPAHNAMMIAKQEVRCQIVRDMAFRTEAWTEAKNAQANQFCAQMA